MAEASHILRLSNTINTRFGREAKVLRWSEKTISLEELKSIVEKFKEKEKNRKPTKQKSKGLLDRPQRSTEVKHEIANVLKNYWVPGHRQNLALYFARIARRVGWSKEDVRDVIRMVCEETNDEEIEKRIIDAV